jgi:hypothetical protein
MPKRPTGSRVSPVSIRRHVDVCRALLLRRQGCSVWETAHRVAVPFSVHGRALASAVAEGGATA